MTLDNQFSRVHKEGAAERYPRTGRVKYMDKYGNLERDWDGAEPTIAFLVQVCMFVYMRTCIHGYIWQPRERLGWS